MKYFKVEPSELRQGDILVTSGRAFVSGVIRKSTGTDFSHTILYIGGGKVIEAIADGVKERSLSKATEEASLAIALRRRFMTGKAKDDVVRYAKSFVGRPYDTVGATGAGLAHNRGKAMGLGAALLAPKTSIGGAIAVANNARDKNKDKKFFCSELAARCYELAGVPIDDGSPSFTTPRSVRVAKNLMYMGHLIGGPF